MDSSPWARSRRLPWLAGPRAPDLPPSRANSRAKLLKQGGHLRHNGRTKSVDGNVSSSSARHTEGYDSGSSNTGSAPKPTSSPQAAPAAESPPQSPNTVEKAQTHTGPHENQKPTMPMAEIAQGLRNKTSSTSDAPQEQHHHHTKAVYDRTEADIANEAMLQSISGLERQMQESVHLANDAAHRNNQEEVTNILSEAERTLEHSAHIAEVQRRRIHQQPLEDAGGSVPWLDTALQDSDDEGSTYSRSSSDSDHRPPLSGNVQRRPTIGQVEPLSPTQAVTGGQAEGQDWASKGPGLGLPSSLKRRQTQTRFADPDGNDRKNDAGTRSQSNEAGPIKRSLTIKAPQASNESLAVAPFDQPRGQNWGRDKYEEKDYISTEELKGKNHITLRDDQKFSVQHHKRQPIARNWETPRKRFTATVACINTAVVGIIVGIYAGEVPAIQYAMNDLDHRVILGNVVLYLGMSITTFIFWPLPLLHGRRPYKLIALAIALPLQFPQAIMVGTKRVGDNSRYMTGLLVSRACSGLALGFAHINTGSVLLDLFGASLQATHPHGELVIVDDVRRHGGGMGLWLGGWTFSFIGSLGFGFMIGAEVVSGLNVAWGFYITVILIAAALLLDVMAPETRRSAHRRTMAEVELPNMNIARRVARGEIKMHVYGDGPKWWWEEVFAGLYLSLKMVDQPGFGLMALYLGWVYGEVVLVIVLLGNLLSVQYQWSPVYVGLGVLATTVGALLAIPNTKANFFSKSRSNPFRTDSMTFQPRLTWTSHMVRRAAFMILLPLAGIAYTLASAGRNIQYMVPIIFAGLIGYISNLAIAECHGLIMEAFDTSDLQPGVNSRHRLQSLQVDLKRRRTTYSSYPRVSAGLFIAQALGFALAALATGIGGIMTRQVGAQKATGITAGTLFGLTLLLTIALWRFKTIQVIPNHLFGTNFGAAGDKRDSVASMQSDRSWRAVIIGNPSGKFRRMNLLELGGLSRWTEIRRLNRLLTKSSTQPLNPGWR